jgi:hypothetical protein
MASSGMFSRVALVITDVSEGPSAYFIRVTRIGELITTVAVSLRSVRRLLVTANVPSSPIHVILMKETLNSSETSVLTTATRRSISEDAILQAVFMMVTSPKNTSLKRMPSYGMLCRVAFVRTRVSEKHSASIIRVTRNGELRTTLAVTSNRTNTSSQRASIAGYS